MTTKAKQPNTINGKCSACGGESLTLAKDTTAYSPCTWDTVHGAFTADYSHTEESSADDAVRFFCADCGEYHAVPRELT